MGLVHGNWDYIVVGAGAAGCTVAPELAASGKSVLVLEAGLETAWAFGGRDNQATFGTLNSETVFDVPGENERIRRNRNYWWSNVPWGLNGRGIGGSGMMNGAATFIPSPDDFRSWPWGWKYFQIEPNFRTTLSKLSVTTTPSSDGQLYVQGSAEAFEKMAKNRLGLREVGINDNPHDRVGTFSRNEVTAKSGKRMDACLAFLLPAMNSNTNLKLMTDAEVKRITFEPMGTARGVILKKDNSEIFLNPGGKLVLTAGTFQTARLLQISGVGSRSELERLQRAGLVLNGEKYWIINDEVGQRLHDHSFSQMTFQVPNVNGFAFRYAKFQNDPTAGPMYISNQKGPYAQYGPVRLGFLAQDGNTSPDVELLVMTSGVEGSHDRDCDTCFRILVMNLRPRAREPFQIKTPDMQCDCGGATCATGDICKPKLYLTNQDDVAVLQWAYERIVDAALAEGYKVLTPIQHDKEGIADFLKNNGEAKFSASHWAGSCKLGECTDMNLKVKGTSNIFVADSSVFPNPVRAHNVATVIAVAHKAGGIIRGADTQLAS